MSTSYGTPTNFWLHSPSTGFDLTRGSNSSSKSIITNKGPIKTSISQSALVIIDMQNYFLHPEIRSHPLGLEAMKQLIEVAIPAAKKCGMKIIWCNWGLTDEDVVKMPGSHASSFGAMLRSTSGEKSAGFGFEMDSLPSCSNVGRLLFRDQWNSQLYGELQTIYEEGVNDGSSVWIHKDRMSSMWGESTLMEKYLVEQGIKTLFWSGVNTDQCVWGSSIDAHNKGYDCILVKDLCGTTSPDECRVATIFNSELIGFSTTAEEFAKGLK